MGSDSYVFPEEWQRIVKQYPNAFSPRMIWEAEGKYWWQAQEGERLDISRWKLYWQKGGVELLATLGEWSRI